MDPIKKAIDELLLGEGDTVQHFLQLREELVIDRETFLKEVVERLDTKKMESFIERKTCFEDGCGGWEFKYIYGEVDHPDQSEMMYDEVHGLYQDEFGSLAHHNWLVRKRKQTDEILKLVNEELGTSNKRLPMKVGLTWMGDNDLKTLYDGCMKSGLFTDDTSWELFKQIFNKQRDLDGEPLKWKHDKITLGFFMALLLEKQLIDNRDYNSQINKGNLFTYRIHIPVQNLRKEVSKCNGDGEIETSGGVYLAIQKILDEVS